MFRFATGVWDECFSVGYHSHYGIVELFSINVDGCVLTAKDRELCRMMKEGFSLDHVLASIIKTCGGSPDEQLTLVVSDERYSELCVYMRVR